ncbi:MAG: site-2 protease family protein [Oscillospiraceae bacterium]|nr:site-2 protease family protein [Oscillospiraceae bacterium]
MSLLIVVHELGHFWMARKRGVRVHEFAVGMGPVIFSRQKKLDDGTDGTRYTIRVLPIGGFCALGEDTESDEPDSIMNASKTSRFLIFAAGSAMNLLLGLLISFILVAPVKQIVIPTLTGVSPGSSFSEHAAFGSGFTFEKIDGHRVLVYEDITLLLEIAKGREIYITGKTASGERVSVFGRFERRDIEGVFRYGINFDRNPDPTLLDKSKLAVSTAANYCRLVWLSLGEIISGRVGADALAGPVGLGGIVNDIVTEDEISVFSKVWSILNLMTLVSLNLGIFNLLPLPALDGGRIILIAVEAVRRKPIPAKYEGWIHGAGFAAFLGLMVFVFYNDIVRLVSG